ncbi:MAG: hypothetical protein LBN38_08755 [Verrucomicrobiota bacterium]|nr:hypothetical protein [Verrucomicrobiota bacterium]
MRITYFNYFRMADIFVAALLLVTEIAFGKEVPTESPAQIQLREEIGKMGSESENLQLIKNLRIEVARIGDQAERKRIREALRDADPVRQYEAIMMAKAVRGSDMICGLAELLSDTNGYRSISLVGADQDKRQDDIVFAPPRIEAAKALAEIVNVPLVSSSGGGKPIFLEKDVIIWKKWWHDNKQRYE